MDHISLLCQDFGVTDLSQTAKQCFRTASLPRDTAQVCIKQRLPHMNVRREGAAGPTAPGAAPPPAPHKGHFTTQRTPFETANLFFFSTRVWVFLTFLLMTLSPRVFQCGRVNGGMEQPQTETGAANPEFALFTSALPLYRLHFKYIRFLPYLHIPLFSLNFQGVKNLAFEIHSYY